jgi:hypothetical protein
MADDIEFLGDFSGFRFRIGNEVLQVEMDTKGFLVLNTKDDLVLRYGTWEEFQAVYPEVSVFMVREIRRKMNETIQVVQQWQIQNAMPEVMPVPAPLENGDCMYHRAYQ